MMYLMFLVFILNCDVKLELTLKTMNDEEDDDDDNEILCSVKGTHKPVKMET